MSRIRFNFQAKVLIPVVGVLVLFFVATMWLLNWRIKNQLRSEATESLTTAQAVFAKTLRFPAQNLQEVFGPVCNQSLFMSVIRLHDEKTLQVYLRDMLKSVTSDAKTALFTTDKGELLAATNLESGVNLKKLHAICLPFIEQALEEHNPKVDFVQFGSQLLDVVSIPVFDAQKQPLGVLTLPIDLGKSINEFKLQPQSEIVFVAKRR